MEIEKHKYANLHSERPTHQRDPSISALEIKTIELTYEEPEYNDEKKYFVIKPESKYATIANFENFKIRKCEKVTSIKYNDIKYSSMSNPQNKADQYFINDTYLGGYKMDPDDHEPGRKYISRPIMETFIRNVNLSLNLENIRFRLRFYHIIRILVIIWGIINTCLSGFYILNIIFYLLSLMLEKPESEKEEKEMEGVAPSVINITVGCSICLFSFLIIYFLLIRLKASKEFVKFTYRIEKKPVIEALITQLNRSQLFPINMKCAYSPTLNYFHITFDRASVYMYDSHFD